MLLKPFTAYVAGVATVAFAHSCASGEPGKLGFALGVVTAFLLLAWLLGSSRRQQRAGKFLLRLSGAYPRQKPVVNGGCEKTAQVKPEPELQQTPPPLPFVMMGEHEIKIDDGWQDFQKLSKKKKLDRQYQAWRELGQKKITQRAADQQQARIQHPLKPGDPNYDFMMDPELVGEAVYYAN